METVLSLFGRDLLGACPKDLDENFLNERQKLIDEMPLEDEELVAIESVSNVIDRLNVRVVGCFL